MPKPTAAAVAEILQELALRMELEGANPYRARAYSRAAENLKLVPQPLDQVIAEGRLREVPGVGDAIAGVITEIYRSGQYSRLDALRTKAPQGVLDMLRIPGLNADRVRKLYRELGIASIAELEAAAREDRLKSHKGYGPAFQAKVMQGIEMSRQPQGRHLHRAAAAIAYAIADIKKRHPNLTAVTPAGDFRRGCELIRDLAIVALDPELNTGMRSLKQGNELTIHIAAPATYGITLLLATGSQAHVAALAAFARKKGYVLDERGLRKGARIVAQQSEDNIYAALGLPWIAPELRETGDEVQVASEGGLPELVEPEDIRGILHAHTDQSDGSATLKEMADAARARGYQYLGLTDHSQSASYAGGLKAEDVKRQQVAIDKLNKRYGSGFRIFKGIESDILPDGSLDFPENVLRRFDFIVASVHSRFRMSRKEQTDRIIKAVKNPYTTILGHVTGRQLLKRPGYEVDMERVLRACAKYGVAIEINAHPWRLDMDWRWCKRGLELGCMFSIDPDAHSRDEIDNVRWGVLMARKGAVPKDRVLSAFTLEEFHSFLAARKKPHRSRDRRNRGLS